MGQSSIANTALTIPLSITANPLVTDYYVDIAQCLSIINRRSYRQGMNYAIQSIEIAAVESGSCAIYSVPTTWVADNAITKAFETWKDQRAEVLKESPSLKAKWSDFKVFLDSGHVSSGISENLIPSYIDLDEVGIGDWHPAELAIPLDGGSGGSDATPEVTLHVVGDNVPAGSFAAGTTTSASLIEAYAQSRGIILAPDPDQPVASNLSLYNELASHDELSEQVLNNVANANDEPPYDKDNYPGGTKIPSPQFVDQLQCQNYGDTTTGLFATDITGSFVAPMGLLKLYVKEFSADTLVSIIIRVAPGNYKGVLAERGV